MYKKDVQLLIHNCHATEKKVAVFFCSHIPQEILEAAGICSLRLPYICDAEDSSSKILPRNLCPVVKNCCDICEEDALADADLILAETSCDGKKKMYELLSCQERIYFYQVAQGTDRAYVKPLIMSECRYLIKELKKRFDIDVTNEDIRTAGTLFNKERQSILNLMDIQRQIPPAAWGKDIFRALEEHRAIPSVTDRIDANLASRDQFLAKGSPVPKHAARILITGCPISIVYTKILEIIEENGGVVVCFENCEVIKYADRHFNTETENVLEAIADCYQNTACAIMSPNDLRFDLIRRLSDDYQVEGILDVTLQTCHAYTVERDKMSRFCRDSLGIPYMAIETNDSDSDIGQLTTRITAFIEML